MYKSLLFAFCMFYSFGLQAQTTDRKFSDEGDSLNYLGIEFMDGKLFALSDLRSSYDINYLQIFNANHVMLKFVPLPGDFTFITKLFDQTLFVGTKDTLSQVNYSNDTLKLVYPVLKSFIDDLNSKFLFGANHIYFREVRNNTGSYTLYALTRDEQNLTDDKVLYTYVNNSYVGVPKRKSKNPLHPDNNGYPNQYTVHLRLLAL